LTELYDTHCHHGRCHRDLAGQTGDIKKSEKRLLKRFEKALKRAINRLYRNKSYHPDDFLVNTPYQRLIQATYEVLEPALKHEKLPDELKKAFRKNVFIFSGLKTHAQLLQASRLLLDGDQIKPYYKWRREVEKEVSAPHRRYLEAEYNFAVASSQMAERWHYLTRDGDNTLLQYRTANDERVRQSHRPLHGITLPAKDPFWDKYYPPNGWNCRCTVVRVKDNHPVSDPEKARRLGEKATTYINRRGVNKLRIFRFNPAKHKVVFPPHHPYARLKDGKAAKQNTLILFARFHHDRYAGIPFVPVKGIRNGGRLEIFTKGRQRKHEWFHNKRGYTILANHGEQYRLLPVIHDKNKNPDAFNLKLKIYSDLKTYDGKGSIKNAFQNGMKDADKKAEELVFQIIHPLNKEQKKDLFGILAYSIRENRNKNVKEFVFIFPKGRIFRISRDYLEKRWIKK
jgi:SPP1 gp7 family putative phage head morphogenesis protein